MAITPDPVGAFTSTFQAASSDNRDRARIALLERQMQDKAVADAEQRKADNFNRMLRLISEGNRQAENATDNRRLDAQLGVSRYSAETSRMNALQDRASRNQIDDPLGILGSQTPANRVTSFTGVEGNVVKIPQPGDAFGTGVDADVSSRDNPALRALEADIELAQSGGLPDSYITTPNSPLIEIPPPAETVVGAEVPESAAVVETVAPVAETPAIVPAVAEPVAIPAPSAVAEPALLPPPVEVPSLTDVDISASTRETLAGLERDSQAATRLASLKQAEALRFGRIRDPRYYGPTQQRQAEAIEAATVAQEAKSKAEQIKAELPKIRERQTLLSSLADLDTVLPPAEKVQLVTLASDPATGGQADRQLASLSAYSRIRNERGLSHRSNGLRTADMVARAGANLETPDAKAEKKAADEVIIAQSGLAAITDPESPESMEEAKAYRKILRDNAAGAAAWGSRLRMFERAVQADTRQETPVVTTDSQGNPIEPVEGSPINTYDSQGNVISSIPAEEAPTPAAPPTYDVVSAINSAPRTDYMRPVKDALGIASGDMTPEQVDQWSRAKERVEAAAGGMEGIIAAGAQGSQVKTLEDLKQVVRRALTSRTRSMSATEQSEAGLTQGFLPKNARSILDVADALAEDIWIRRDGRGQDSVAVPGTAPINPANRPLLDEYLKKAGAKDAKPATPAAR